MAAAAVRLWHGFFGADLAFAQGVLDTDTCAAFTGARLRGVKNTARWSPSSLSQPWRSRVRYSRGQAAPS